MEPLQLEARAQQVTLVSWVKICLRLCGLRARIRLKFITPRDGEVVRLATDVPHTAAIAIARKLTILNELAGNDVMVAEEWLMSQFRDELRTCISDLINGRDRRLLCRSIQYTDERAVKIVGEILYRRPKSGSNDSQKIAEQFEDYGLKELWHELSNKENAELPMIEGRVACRLSYGAFRLMSILFGLDNVLRHVVSFRRGVGLYIASPVDQDGRKPKARVGESKEIVTASGSFRAGLGFYIAIPEYPHRRRPSSVVGDNEELTTSRKRKFYMFLARKTRILSGPSVKICTREIQEIDGSISVDPVRSYTRYESTGFTLSFTDRVGLHKAFTKVRLTQSSREREFMEERNRTFRSIKEFLEADIKEVYHPYYMVRLKEVTLNDKLRWLLRNTEENTEGACLLNIAEKILVERAHKKSSCVNKFWGTGVTLETNWGGVIQKESGDPVTLSNVQLADLKEAGLPPIDIQSALTEAKRFAKNHALHPSQVEFGIIQLKTVGQINALYVSQVRNQSVDQQGAGQSSASIPPDLCVLGKIENFPGAKLELRVEMTNGKMLISRRYLSTQLVQDD